MSGSSDLQLDADGFVDMDQFPDDGTDLGGAELDQLRTTLHSDPVDEPTDEQWDAMFDEVVTTDDAGPFALDDVDDGLTSADAASSDDGSDPVASDDDASSDDTADDVDLDSSDDAAATDDLVFDPADDDATADDLDLDYTDADGGLDLAPDDGVDEAFSPEALDDAPADIANNDFEDLL